MSRSIRELALVSLHLPVYISAHEKAKSSTPSKLTQVTKWIVDKRVSSFSLSSIELHCLWSSTENQFDLVIYQKSSQIEDYHFHSEL